MPAYILSRSVHLFRGRLILCRNIHYYYDSSCSVPDDNEHYHHVFIHSFILFGSFIYLYFLLYNSDRSHSRTFNSHSFLSRFWVSDLGLKYLNLRKAATPREVCHYGTFAIWCCAVIDSRAHGRIKCLHIWKAKRVFHDM